MDALFEQAGIKIEKQQDFQMLKESIERLLGSALIEKFLKRMEKKGIRIRQFEKVLEQRVMEDVDETLKASGKVAKQVYAGLPVTDQGQIREFYLTRIEEVSPELRQKFNKIYSYY